MNTAVHFSSATDNWATPQDFFDKLNRIFDFTLDPCASDSNHKAEKYFTIEDNGLEQSWDGERTFMNPPYGREIGKWVKKASEQKGGLAVCLVPARTDTKWWHDYVVGGGRNYMVFARPSQIWRSSKLSSIPLGSRYFLGGKGE